MTREIGKHEYYTLLMGLQSNIAALEKFGGFQNVSCRTAMRYCISTSRYASEDLKQLSLKVTSDYSLQQKM